jgi:hypothetical protein
MIYDNFTPISIILNEYMIYDNFTTIAIILNEYMIYDNFTQVAIILCEYIIEEMIRKKKKLIFFLPFKIRIIIKFYCFSDRNTSVNIVISNKIT